MNICKKCSGLGEPDGCPSCGTYRFTNRVVEEEVSIGQEYTMPLYYKKNVWSEDKLRFGDNQHCNAVLQVLNQLINRVAKGIPFDSSYIILLPYGHGKKTAMYTIIQQYLKHNKTVAPVIDIASLALMENNFRLNRKDIVEKWEDLINSDLVCVYGVDFSARYQTMQLFLNLCSIRALRNKPTLLFAQNSLAELRSKALADHLSEENNLKDVGCKLSNPYILDGIRKGRK